MISLLAVLLLITSSLGPSHAQECYREDQRISITDQTTVNVVPREDEFLIYILGIREVQVSGQVYDVYGIRQCGKDPIVLDDPRVQTCNSAASNVEFFIRFFACMDLFNEGHEQADIQIFAYPKTSSDCPGSDFKFLLINTTGSS